LVNLCFNAFYIKKQRRYHALRDSGDMARGKNCRELCRFIFTGRVAISVQGEKRRGKLSFSLREAFNASKNAKRYLKIEEINGNHSRDFVSQEDGNLSSRKVPSRFARKRDSPLRKRRFISLFQV